MRVALVTTAAMVALAATPALAEQDETVTAAAPTASLEGAFSPGLLPASTKGQAAVARVLGGYDSAAEAGAFDSEVRVRLFGPLSLRAGTSYSAATERFRPRAGAAVQLLDQSRHGVDGSLALTYKAEGFTEPEGEIELEAALGRRFGRVMTVLNLVYGQDPEGRERDGEVRVAGVAQLTHRLHAGVAASLRFDLGEEGEAATTEMRAEPELDLVVGPTVAYAWDRFALLGQVGLSAVQAHGASLRAGGIVLAGIGAAF